MANNVFMKGLKNSYMELQTKNPNTIYFCIDTREMFVGEDLYTEPVRFYTGTLPTIPAQGILYLNTESGTGSVHNGTVWVTVIKPSVVIIDSSASDDTIPTSKAVKEYVDSKIDDVTGGEGIITNIESKEDETGVLVITKGDGSEDEVELKGVAHDVEYDSTNLKITIPMVGKSDLVINLPEDNFIESGLYNPETESIDLVFKNGGTVSIPASHLVDVYISGSGVNDTITITVDGDNKITASIKVDTSDGILGISADGTLTINLNDYATISYLEDRIGDIEEDTIKEYVDSEIDAIIGSLTDISERVDEIEDSLTWGSF